MILDQIYDAAVDEGALAALPGHLASAMGARSTNLLTLTPQWEVEALNFSYFTAEMNEYFFQNALWEHDLWMQLAMKHAQNGRVSSCDEYMTPDTFKSGVFYNDFIRRFGDDTVHCFGTSFRAGSKLYTLGIQRAEGGGAFEAEQVASLQALVPHLTRALALKDRMAIAKSEAAAATAVLDRMRVSILRLDRIGRILFANRRAELLLGQGDGIRFLNQRIRFSQVALQDRFDNAVMSAADRKGGLGDAMTCHRPSLAPPYKILVAPANMGLHGQALVLIDDQSNETATLAQVFASMFGLTAGEARIAVLLSEGLTPEEAANVRQVSITTVRTQVRSILSKMDRRRLAEATIDLARIAAVNLSQ